MKIQVDVKFEYPPVEDAEPKFLVVGISRKGKDGFESTVKIPVGEVSSKEFVKAVQALYMASQAFHHQIYTRLREELSELKRGKKHAPSLLEKDQRGS